MPVTVPPDSTGKVIDTTTLSGKERQIANIGDPATVAAIAAVLQGHGSDGQTLTGYELMAAALNLRFNETGFDRERGNTSVSLLASAARTTTQTSADIVNYNAKGIHVVLDVTSAGSASLTVTIKGKDPASGKYYTLLAGAAVTTNSTNVYKVYPGLPATANVSANDILPRTFQIVVTAADSNSATYSVGYSLDL